MFIFNCALSTQTLNSTLLLHRSLNEILGLVYIVSKLITHTHSGGAAELYAVNTATGTVNRTVTITNATNVDWEKYYF